MEPVREELDPGVLPLWRHPAWRESLPWLVQATTGAGGDEPFDLGLFGDQPVGDALERWRKLREGLAMPTAVHARQVHGAQVLRHDDPMQPGLLITEGRDAHVTRRPGVLLSVSVADCVPVFVVDERQRGVGLAHAGWRGVAGGVLETTLRTMAEGWGSRPDDLRVHFGPSICGRCYEVGPEVHAAVHPDREPPSSPTPIDLRQALATRATGWGVERSRISVSAHCTRCGPGDFFSHRGGSAARQMGIIGILG